MSVELRTTKCYPVPPVCTVYWTDDDWERTAFYITEPEFVQWFDHTWKAVDRDERGHVLYQLQPKEGCAHCAALETT